MLEDHKTDKPTRIIIIISTVVIRKTGRFLRQWISPSIMQLILQTLVPNESSCSLDLENVPGLKI